PLTTASSRLGALAFGSAKPDNYSEEDLEFLQQVARQTALAIDNAINFERALSAEREATRRLEQLQLLLEVNNNIATHLDLRELFKAISSCLRRVIKFDGAVLTIYEPEVDMLRVHALHAGLAEKTVEEGMLVEIQDTPGGLAFTSRKTVLIRGLSDLEKFSSPLLQVYRDLKLFCAFCARSMCGRVLLSVRRPAHLAWSCSRHGGRRERG